MHNVPCSGGAQKSLILPVADLLLDHLASPFRSMEVCLEEPCSIVPDLNFYWHQLGRERRAAGLLSISLVCQFGSVRLEAPSAKIILVSTSCENSLCMLPGSQEGRTTG